jgi:hypothetical protein
MHSVGIINNDLGVRNFEDQVAVKSRNRKIEYCTLIIMYLNVLLLKLVFTKQQTDQEYGNHNFHTKLW